MTMPLAWGRRREPRDPNRNQQVESLVDRLTDLVDRLNESIDPVFDQRPRKDGHR